MRYKVCEKLPEKRKHFIRSCLFAAVILVVVLPDGLFSQTGRKTSRPKLPEDGIIVRWARREPMKIYAGHINWTVVIRTGIHRNNQDPPEGSTHSAPPFKGELKSPRFYFEVLPHPELDWGKPVLGLVLTISSKVSKMAVGDPIIFRLLYGIQEKNPVLYL